jgi:hypothetical protein
MDLTTDAGNGNGYTDAAVASSLSLAPRGHMTLTRDGVASNTIGAHQPQQQLPKVILYDSNGSIGRRHWSKR